MASNGSGVWNALAENAPKIIAEAARSGLGILALVILVLAVLAVIFFWKDQPRIKLSAFGALVVAFVGIGLVAVYQEAARDDRVDQDRQTNVRPDNGPKDNWRDQPLSQFLEQRGENQ